MFMKRKIMKDLVEWKNSSDKNKPYMILGARQVGKTYILKEFCRNNYNNFVYVNLEQNQEEVVFLKRL